MFLGGLLVLQSIVTRALELLVTHSSSKGSAESQISIIYAQGYFTYFHYHTMAIHYSRKHSPIEVAPVDRVV